MRNMFRHSILASVALAFAYAMPATAQSTYTIPDDLTPVSKWADGFTADEAKHFIKAYNAKSFVIGDDIGTYGFLNLSEVLPVSKVFRSGDVAKLEVDIDESIGKFKVDGPLGDLTLEEVMKDKRSRMQGIIVLKQGRIVYEKYPGIQRHGLGGHKTGRYPPSAVGHGPGGECGKHWQSEDTGRPGLCVFFQRKRGDAGYLPLQYYERRKTLQEARYPIRLFHL